ncbi:MAG: NosD domain-containing protein [Candidatus Bathyarchaeia archaeon]
MNTTISGITISGSIHGLDYPPDEIFSTGQNNSIIGNTVNLGAIRVENSSQDLISKNIVNCSDRYLDSGSLGHGIWLINVTDCIIRENVVNGAKDAIQYSGSNCSIYANNVTNCRHGIIGNGDQTIVDSNRLVHFWTEQEASIHSAGDTLALEFSGTNHIISHNFIANSSNRGIVLNVFNATVESNVAENCAVGFVINGCNNTVTYNNITGNTASIARALGDDSIAPYGLVLGGSNMTLRNNMMEKNKGSFNLSMQGDLSNFINDVDTSNKIDGRPIYYWVDKHNLAVPNDAGYVALVNCTNITVQNLNLTNNGQSLLLAFTTNSTIANNSITANRQGILLRNSPRNIIRDNYVAINNPGLNIELVASPNCTIYRNIIASSTYGVILTMSNNTRVIANTLMYNYYGANLYLNQSWFCVVYHNNFIQEPGLQGPRQLVIVSGSNNTFDNGYPSGGNFWSDYVGVDSQATGVGFPYYIISGEAQDKYPLMGQIHEYDIVVSGNIFQVDIESNSTVSGFQYLETAKAISFNVEGSEGTRGFCRITVPKLVYQQLWQSNISIFINGTKVQFSNFTDSENVYFYFFYEHSARNIIVVPWYLLLFLILLFVVVGIFEIKHRKRSDAALTKQTNDLKTGSKSKNEPHRTEIAHP